MPTLGEMKAAVIAALAFGGLASLLSLVAALSPWSSEVARAHRHFDKAERLRNQGNAELAQAELGKVVTILEDSNRYKLLVKAYLMEGDIAMDRGQTVDAVRFYTLCIENARHIKTKTDLSALHFKLGAAYLKDRKLDDAFRHLDQAREMQERRDSPALAETYRQIAEVQRMRHFPDGAIDYYLRAFTRQERIGDVAAQAGTRAAMANLYFEKGDISLATENFHSAAALYRKVGHHDTAAMYSKRGEELAAESPGC